MAAKKTYSLEYQDNLGLVHLQAKLGLKLAAINHAGWEYDDAFQEASVAFVLAARGFDPNAGVTFSAYYTKVAFSQFRRAIGLMTGVKNLNPKQRQEIADRRAENAKRAAAGEQQLPEMAYGLRPINFSDVVTSVGDEGDPFIDCIASDAPTPEEQLELKEQWARAFEQLSPLAQLVVEWLRDPPPELLRELNAQMEFADKAQQAGERRRGLRDGLTLANIGRFLNMVSDGATKGEFAMVEKELLDAVASMEV